MWERARGSEQAGAQFISLFFVTQNTGELNIGFPIQFAACLCQFRCYSTDLFAVYFCNVSISNYSLFALIARVFGENCPHFAATCTQAGGRAGERERQRDQSTEKYKWGGRYRERERVWESNSKSYIWFDILVCVCAEQWYQDLENGWLKAFMNLIDDWCMYACERLTQNRKPTFVLL